MECVWCLLLMGHLQDQNRSRLLLLGCRQRLTTVDDTASPSMPTQASTLNAIYPGHVPEEEYTAGSQPNLKQWVTSLICQLIPPDIPQFIEAMLCVNS